MVSEVSASAAALAATPANGVRCQRRAECHIIALWRDNSAHLHRPWRATLEYAIGAEYRRFHSSVWRQYRGENCSGGAVDELGQCLLGLGFSAAARTE